MRAVTYQAQRAAYAPITKSGLMEHSGKPLNVAKVAKSPDRQRLQVFNIFLLSFTLAGESARSAIAHGQTAAADR
jgi:hypothetical protein